jgi:hypothetical protein
LNNIGFKENRRIMMKKRWIALLLGAAVTGTLFTGNVSAVYAKDDAEEILPPTGNLDFDDALIDELTVTIDGEEVKVTQYTDFYIPDPSITDQRISIYIPEGATAESPIVLCVNNSGWQANSFSSRTRIEPDSDGNNPSYSSNSDSDKVGAILSRNYVLVSYGCRSRNNEAVDGVYDGHSPATITDTKAVIRYLRNNQELLPAGDTDKIVITGTSGGGALSTVIAASGDSSDYYESLYEIGAAGVEMDGDSYVSTISDDVFAVIAYCPITDLPNADAAYEWTYKDTRAELEGVDFNTDPDKDAQINYSEEKGTVNAEVSETLASAYAEYVDSLGLLLDDGTALTSENLRDAITGLMEDEIAEAIEEVGIEQMESDIAVLQTNGKDAVGDLDWVTFNEDGTFNYDYDKHLNYVASNTKLKVVCAFSNKGLPWANTSEDSLFGSSDMEYSAFEFYSWDNDSVEGNGCGLDDTGLTWEEYIETEDGQALLQQMRMTNAVAYLNDSEGEDAGTKANNWYVRYGMNDRDSSFALETILRYSISNNADIENYSFEFTWLKPHSGDYDVNEAYAWLDSIL